MVRLKKLVVAFLCMALIIGTFASMGTVMADAAEEKPSKYVSSTSTSVSNVMIGLTPFEMKKQVNNNATCTFSYDGELHTYVDNFKFNESGCAILYLVSKCRLVNTAKIGTDPEFTKPLSYVSEYDAAIIDYFSTPVDSGNVLYSELWSEHDGVKYGYIDFIPASKMVKPDYCVENSDGTYTFYLTNISKKIDYTSVGTFEGFLTSYEASEKQKEIENIGQSTDNGAKITLPAKGAYTLFVTTNMDDSSSMNFVFQVNTKDYVKKSAVKVANPLAAFAGTKVIVGKASPDATVKCTYGKKDYKAKADSNGIYVIKIDTALKKGSSFKLWQVVGKMTSAKRTVKISE